MGMEINFYEDLSTGRDKLVYQRLNKEFYDSETLFEELVWSKDLSGKGGESGVFGCVDQETLKEIIEENEEELRKEMTEHELNELKTIADSYSYTVCKIVN